MNKFQLEITKDRILALEAIRYAKSNSIKPTQKNLMAIKEQLRGKQ